MSTAAQRKAWNEAMKSAGAILPKSSDRRGRKARREKARKSTSYAGGVPASSEDRDYRVALHMDMLEGVTDVVDVEDDEDYDELEELEDDEDEGKKRGANKKKRRKRTAAVGAGSVPKHMKARSLASILIEEANRTDSVAKQYVNAAVKSKPNVKPRKFCPVTGLPGIYVDPKSGIPYASLTALDQIRERAPPWMNAAGAGSYWEACRTLRNEE